jgi:uncharacterized protein YdiU (UPF0061 family)
MPEVELSYTRLGSEFYENALPARNSSPKMLLFNNDLATQLGLTCILNNENQLAEIFSGHERFNDFTPISLAYAGHQFGHFVPLLGDGRAHLIGEARGMDIQLKGSGRSSFSRRGDGKAALGPVIREYILSESMHHLGIPTTRALAAVATGDLVQRDGLLAGGIVTRVAKSHLRIGTFEYARSRGRVDELKRLADFTIEKCYPDLVLAPDKYLELFRAASQKYLGLIARWMGIGFIHGVMNTDNSSLSGETIDYGPCAFMDNFSFERVFSSIDQRGRYRYSQQPAIGMWNLTSLANCFIPLIHEDEKVAIGLLEQELDRLSSFYQECSLKVMTAKLGILHPIQEDLILIQKWLSYLEKHQLDFTNSFRSLMTIWETNHVSDTFIADEEFNSFMVLWKNRLSGQDKIKMLELMGQSNPLYIPRNHLVEKAIQEAYQGRLAFTQELIQILSTPYVFQEGKEEFLLSPGASQLGYKTFCGT